MMLWKLYSHLISLSKRLSRKGVYPFLEAQMSSVPAGSRVLAVGAGGPVAELARRLAEEKGFSLTLFDVSTEYKKPDIVGDICTYDFGREEIFRCVVMSEVLEHLHEPAGALSRVHRWLEKDGTLVLTVPFIFPLHDRPHDYFRFTRFGLELLLKDFRDVAVQERNSWGEALNVLVVRLVMENARAAQIAAPLLIAFAFLAAPPLMLASRVIKTDYLTTGYLVVARK